MSRRPTTALLEFLPGSAWAWIVAPNLWHRAVEGGSITQQVFFHQSLCFEVSVNSSHSCSGAHNQFLACLSADWLLIGAHFRIGVVFVCQGKNRHKPSAMFLVI